MRPLTLWLVLTGMLGLTETALAQAQVGNAFTYQGRLDDGGAPADGLYDLEFRLFASDSGGSPIVTFLANDIDVIDGVFATPVDFGAGQFGPFKRWLEVGVRPGASPGAFTTIAPRIEFTPAPIALSLKMPYQAWANFGSNAALSIKHLGAGRALELFGFISNTQPTLYAETLSTNNAAHAAHFAKLSGSTASAVYATATADGEALHAEGTNGADGLYGYVEGAGDAIVGAQNTPLLGGTPGTGRAGYFVAGSGTADVVEVLSLRASGNALNSHIEFASSSAVAVNALTKGTGRAGRFEVDNASNNASGLFAVHNGTGNCFAAVHQGTGRAGFFQIANASSFASALYATHNGAGAAADVNQSGTGTGMRITLSNLSNVNPALTITQLNHSVPALNVGGWAKVDVLEVAGADVAERFPSDDELTPGQVVEIDPNSPGRIRLSRSAYNHRVAGIVSGANGLPAGTVLGNLDGNRDAPAIALTGRVWVQCDADSDAILPGDLLTTSPTPGHAMKAADRDRAYGATIGKAMSGLQHGRGLVLVLVNLQ